jgi:LPXTG-motif cell wall-anchored protein
VFSIPARAVPVDPPSPDTPAGREKGITLKLRGGLVAALAAVLLVVALEVPAFAASVSIVDDAFSPKTITVHVGDIVTWSDNGHDPHTVTADSGAFDSSPSCPSDVSTCLHFGSTYSHTFSTAGTFAYHCKIHGAAGGIGMSGVVLVEDASGSVPGGTGGLPNTGAGSDLPWVFGIGVALLIGGGVLLRERRWA